MKRSKSRLVPWNEFVYSKVIIELIVNDSLEDLSYNWNNWNRAVIIQIWTITLFEQGDAFQKFPVIHQGNFQKH